MGKVKLLLDVVEDMETLGQHLKAAADSFCHLAHSIKTAATAIRENESATAEKPKAVSAPKPKAKPLTIEEVRAVLRPRIPIAGQDAIQDLLRKHGAPLLSDIPAEKYTDLVADAKELMKNGSPVYAPTAVSVRTWTPRHLAMSCRFRITQNTLAVTRSGSSPVSMRIAASPAPQ